MESVISSKRRAAVSEYELGEFACVITTVPARLFVRLRFGAGVCA
jgi:hypothetical protein